MAYHELAAILVLVGALGDPFLIAEDTLLVHVVEPWHGIIFLFWCLFFILIAIVVLLGWLCAILIFFRFFFKLCTTQSFNLLHFRGIDGLQDRCCEGLRTGRSPSRPLRFITT